MKQEQIEIIQTAMRLFIDKGLKFTMQDIADQMHIAKKTIYAYYASKEDLLIGIIDYGFAEIHTKKKNILDSSLPFNEKLRQVMIAMPDQYSVFDFRQLSGLHEKYPNAYHNLNAHLESDWEPVLQLLEEGQKAGMIRNINIPVLRMMITASFESFLSQDGLKKAGISYYDALNDMMDIIMEGITRRQNEDYQQ